MSPLGVLLHLLYQLTPLLRSQRIMELRKLRGNELDQVARARLDFFRTRF